MKTKELLSIDNAAIIAINIAGKIKPELTEKEQSFFISGFQECLKYIYINKIHIFSVDEFNKISKDIINLGMSLRQDQLNGYSDKSGDEILKEYINNNINLISDSFPV